MQMRKFESRFSFLVVNNQDIRVSWTSGTSKLAFKEEEKGIKQDAASQKDPLED